MRDRKFLKDLGFKLEYSWIDNVEEALINLGGESHLSSIYEQVRRMRSERKLPTGKLESWVRNALESNSRGEGYNIFEPVFPIEMRKGIWKLKDSK